MAAMTAEKKKFPWWLVPGAVLVVAAVVEIWRRGGFELADVTDALAGLNPALVILLMAALPVVGFSVSIVYVVAGAKFGPVLGGVVVAGATAVHLLASHWIGRGFLRERIERLLARRKHHLPHVPPGENISVAAMAALVPGLPYFARNYLLAVTDVPLRVYFWVCLPIYVVRSYVAILLGDLGTDPDRKTFFILAGVYVVKLSICAVLIWRIRRRWKAEQAATAMSSANEAVGTQRRNR